MIDGLIITFASTHDAIHAQQVLGVAGIFFAVIPTPVQFSSDCGIALRIAQEDRVPARQLLQSAFFHDNSLTDG